MSATTKVLLRFSKDGQADVDNDKVSKRWSNLKHKLFPVLQDIMQSGDEHNIVLGARDRFQLAAPCAWDSLHESLENTDLSLALPALRKTDRLSWVANVLSAWNKSIGTFQANNGTLYSSISLPALNLESPDGTSLALQVASCRSHIILVTLEVDEVAGCVKLLGGRLHFQTLANTVCGFYEKCKFEDIPIPMKAISFAYRGCGSLAPLALQPCLESVDLSSGDSSDAWIAYDKAVLTDAQTDGAILHTMTKQQVKVNSKKDCPPIPDTGKATGEDFAGDEAWDDFAAGSSGYGFVDVEASAEAASSASRELDDDSIRARDAARIQRSGILQGSKKVRGPL